MKRASGAGAGGAPAVVAAFLASLAGAPPASGEPVPVRRAPIVVDPPPARGLVELVLPPEILDAAAPDRADLRVRSAGGTEVPYVLSIDAPRMTETRLPATLLDRAWVPGRSASVVARFETKVRKNRVVVLTGGREFRRRVRIEGSDDGVDWRIVRDGALLLRTPPGPDGQGLERSAVALPENDFLQLRITVTNGADDPERLEILDVSAWRRRDMNPRAQPVTVRPIASTWKDKRTELDVDLGFRHLPLRDLEFGVADLDFQRRVTVLGRDAVDEPVKVRADDGGTVERRVEVPWTPLASGVIWRFSSGGPVEESVTLPLDGRGYRFLRVRIEDRDDLPLALQGINLTANAVRLRFPPKGETPWVLELGDPGAHAPSYDLPAFADRLAADGVTPATVGPLAAPALPPASELPWWERHRTLVIWPALGLALLVLAVLVRRQAAAARHQEVRAGDGRPPDGGTA